MEIFIITHILNTFNWLSLLKTDAKVTILSYDLFIFALIKKE